MVSSASHRVESSSDISIGLLKRLTLSRLWHLELKTADRHSRCPNSWYLLQAQSSPRWGSDTKTKSMRKDWHHSLISLPFICKAQGISSNKTWQLTNCSPRKPRPRLLNSTKDISSHEQFRTKDSQSWSCSWSNSSKRRTDQTMDSTAITRDITFKSGFLKGLNQDKTNE